MRLPVVRSVLIALATLGTPAIAQDRAAAGEAALARITADRTPGKPVSCINQRDIRSSEIVPEAGIVYRMNNGTLMVNRTNGASALRRDDILVTRTIGTRLCSIDIVNLIDRGSRFFTGSVALDQFVPYSRLPRRSD